jgi:hypothetical protein
MDIFSKIDVFEEKVHEQITERVSLFTNIMQDNEIFCKVILESSEYNDIDIGVAIDSSTKEIITDIQTNDKIVTLMKNKFKKNQMIKPNDTTLPHGRRLRIFDSKNYSSNLTVSPFLNYFHQKQIEFRIRPNNFYSKATELSLITSLFREMFKNQIRKKLYIAQNDSYLSQGINSARTKELLNINKSVVASKSSNLDSNNQSAILSCSTDRKTLIWDLYPIEKSQLPSALQFETEAPINDVTWCGTNNDLICMSVDNQVKVDNFLYNYILFLKNSNKGLPASAFKSQ